MGRLRSAVTDILLIVGSLWTLTVLYEQPWRTEHTIVVLWAIGLFVLAVHFSDVYRSWRGSLLRSREFMRLLGAWLTVVLGLLFLAFASKSSKEYSRLLFLTWFVITPYTGGLAGWL
jgi:FlaA1/EpsC-like NDP-sugar epimerase